MTFWSLSLSLSLSKGMPRLSISLVSSSSSSPFKPLVDAIFFVSAVDERTSAADPFPPDSPQPAKPNNKSETADKSINQHRTVDIAFFMIIPWMQPLCEPNLSNRQLPLNSAMCPSSRQGVHGPWAVTRQQSRWPADGNMTRGANLLLLLVLTFLGSTIGCGGTSKNAVATSPSIAHSQSHEVS